MSVSFTEVKKALTNVMDPELGKDLVSLGMIKGVDTDEEGNVKVTVELTTPACPLKNTIREDCIKEVSKIDGVKNVEIHFTARERKQEKEIVLENIKNIVAVGSGKGGVGKSTVCTLLALAFAKKGYKVGILDADAYGPNIPTLLRNFDRPFSTEENRILPIETNGIEFMSLGLLVHPDQAVAWRGPMLHGIVSQFLSDVEWGDLDILFIDTPPGTGDVQLSLGQLVDVNGAIMVTTPQELAIADTKKSISMFRQLGIDIFGIIENMSYFEAPDTGKRYEVFNSNGCKKISDTLNIPLLGELPLNMDLSDPTRDKAMTHLDSVVSNIENLGKLKK